jgi:hypothetical protein
MVCGNIPCVVKAIASTSNFASNIVGVAVAVDMEAMCVQIGVFPQYCGSISERQTIFLAWL